MAIAAPMTAGWQGTAAETRARDSPLLEPATGRRLVTLRLRRDSLIPDVDFSPDGRWLATAEDKSLDLWLLGPVEALIAEACTRLSRNLTVRSGRCSAAASLPATCDRLRVPAASAPPRDKVKMP